MSRPNVKVTNLEHELVPNTADAVQVLTIDNTLGGVQLGAFHANTGYCMYDLSGADVRVTFDGSAPVGGSVGHLWEEPIHCKKERVEMLKAAKFIQNAGSAATLYVTPLTVR